MLVGLCYFERLPSPVDWSGQYAAPGGSLAAPSGTRVAAGLAHDRLDRRATSRSSRSSLNDEVSELHPSRMAHSNEVVEMAQSSEAQRICLPFRWRKDSEVTDEGAVLGSCYVPCPSDGPQHR